MTASKLPDYETPPINEVVLGIQFDALTSLTSAHFGLFWADFRKTYPEVSEQPTLDPSFEVFGTPTLRPLGGQIRIEAFLKPPMPRYWFEEKNESNHLLQVQQDRLLHNWRKKSVGDVYPRYGKIRERFERDFSNFFSFVTREKLGSIDINQAEATYINIITLDPSQNPHTEIARITNIANAWPAGEGLPQLENTLIQSRAILRKDSEPFARLFLNLQPIVTMVDGAPAARLELTVRGKPSDGTFPKALEFLDFAHEAIVNTFTAVTTKYMHDGWGRKNGA